MIITARACPVPLRPTGAAPKRKLAWLLVVAAIVAGLVWFMSLYESIEEPFQDTSATLVNGSH